MSDREDCYQRIRRCMTMEIVDYYKQFPERQLDARSIAAIAFSYHGLERILSVLEDYEITKKPEPC